MLFSSLRQTLATLMVAVLVSACGGSGSSAPPPAGGITVTPGDGFATVTWTMAPGVKYWLFYAKSNTISTTDWINVPGARAMLNVSSPYVVTGLENGFNYSFTVNGRNGDGPGGPGSPTVTIVPRPAGATWKAGTSLGSNTIRGITYGTGSDTLGYYFAVGDAGSSYRSTDGITWAGLPAVNASTNMNAAVYSLSLGKFIVVGANGSIRYGTDMSNWSAGTSNTTETLNAVASNGAMAVTVGNNGTVRTSSDGVTWAAAATVPTTQNLHSVAYSGSGVWLAAGAGGTLMTSTDATNWKLVSSGTTVDLNAVAVQASTSYVFVAAGNGGTVLTSTDGGATWTAQSSGTTATLLAISTTANQVLITGASGSVITSPTGTAWTVRSSGTTADLHAVISGLAQYVAVGQGGTNINSQ